MAHRPFASAPYIVGSSAPAPAEAHIPAEESLCPVVSHDWVNAEYKHLIVDASPKALTVKPGQFFNLLCPSPDEGELWLRRPQSVYRIDQAKRRIEFLYKCVGRGTNGLAKLKRGDDLNMVGPLGVGFSVDPGWKHVVVLGRGVGLATLAPISQLAGESGIGVTAILSARSPEFVMAGDLFAKVGDVVSVLDTDGSSAVENVEAILRAADRPAKSRRVLHLRLESAVSTDEARRQGRTAFPGKSPWSRSWPAGSGPATSACAPSRSTARRNCGACASRGRYSICRRQSDGRHEREDRERDAQEPDHARVGRASRPTSRR